MDTSQIRVGGAVPDSVEQHAAALDYRAAFAPSVSLRLLPSYLTLASDLRPYSPKTRHKQTTTGTCVANATARGAEIKQIQKLTDDAVAAGVDRAQALATAKDRYVPVSRRALYYLARELMPLRSDGRKETDVDDGTQISLAARVLAESGVCPEAPLAGRPATECWPWDTTLVSLCTAPSWMALRSSYVHKISRWAKIKSTGEDLVEDVIANLAVGNPVPWATRCGHAWMSYDGKSALGMQSDIIGMHATCLVGWDPNLFGGVFLFENSWGDYWGDGGFGYMAPEVIASDDSFDFLCMMAGWEDWSST